MVDKLAIRKNINRRLVELEAEWKKSTCSECGVDTRFYSHTFNCKRRGSGF